MSLTSDDAEMPDQKALSKTNPLIPDPSRLEVRVIPAEDIAGWFLPFEIVFGMVYWDRLGVYLLLAFVGTLLFGWIIPAQQRYAYLAKNEFIKEKTQLGHLTWTEQTEFIRFEPVLEPAYKLDEDGRPILDAEEDLIPDELDLADWTTALDLDDKIIESEDGVVSSIISLDSQYVANLISRMAHRQAAEGQRGMVHTLRKVLPKIGKGIKGAGGATKRGIGGFGWWVRAHKVRFIGSFVTGAMLLLFSKWVLFALRFLLKLAGW